MNDRRFTCCLAAVTNHQRERRYMYCNYSFFVDLFIRLTRIENAAHDMTTQYGAHLALCLVACCRH